MAKAKANAGSKSGTDAFMEAYGLGTKDNPKAAAKAKGGSRAKGGSKAKAKGGSSAKAKAKAGSRAKGGSKAKAKGGSRAKGGSKAKAKGGSRAKSCPTAKRCPPTGERFTTRKIGKMTGLVDREAGTGSNKGRVFVKRGDLECGAQNGPGVDFVLEILRESELPAAEKKVRGHYEVWKDRSNNFLVYDRRTATLLEPTFLTREEANDFVSSGGAKEATCKPGQRPPRKRAPKAAGEAQVAGTVNNPGDGYATGTVEGRGRSRSDRARIDSLEDEVSQLRASQQHTIGRVTRLEHGVAGALEMLADGRNGQHRVGANGRRGVNQLD